MTIVDRLGKGVIVEPMKKLDAEYVAWKFVKVFYAYHGLPYAITSDRGEQFVGELWQRICELLNIHRRLSTAYHPQTDGASEQRNQMIEAFFRHFCNRAQSNWATLCPVAMLALNNRDNTSTGVSPFFLDHGFHMETLDIDLPVP